jgi:hypothetical protein
MRLKLLLACLAGLFGVVLVIIGMDQAERGWPVLTGEFWAKPQASTPTQDEGDTGKAWVMATNFVEEKLKSPGTAKWGWQTGRGDDGEKVRHHGDGVYTVSGWVDSQNAFGATVRTNWTVGLKDHGSGKWTATSGPTFSER